MSKLVSIQIGRVQTYTDEQGTWETSFYKKPVNEPVFVTRLGLEGDSQANKKYHGGIEKAVLVYSAEHYPVWQKELGQSLPYGGFAENLTISGFDETTACIGDRLGVGNAVFQITQARVPCWKISRRWGISDLLERVLATGRFGWYCRVLTEGHIKFGVPVHLIERPYPDWSVARAFRVYSDRKSDPDGARQLAKIEVLSSDWRTALHKSLL